MAAAWGARARSRSLMAPACVSGISEWLAQPTTTNARLMRGQTRAHRVRDSPRYASEQHE